MKTLSIQQLRIRDRAAFTIVEILVATAILGFTAVAVFSGLTHGFATVQMARESARATQVLQDRLETLRLYKWSQLTNPGFVPTTFYASANPTNTADTNMLYRGTVTITNAPLSLESYANNMVQVTVSVEWTSGGLDRSRSVTTFVSQYGVQRYIY